jgi:propionaldehyde dehydrogenase
MLVATGGPGVVHALLSSGKKAIGAGAGNPPVIVDDTADIEKTGKEIVLGASFDNNLPCIAEKECFVFNNVADRLISAMTANGAYLIKNEQIDQLLSIAMIENNGTLTLNKKWVGKDARLFLKELGIDADPRLIICETTADHPFVVHELMMPILPIVRVADIDEAVSEAVKAEHGNRHSAHIHSKNVDHLTKFARAVETTIFVKNAPSYAGIGAGGEGYTTFTIAGPTGEGLTAAHSFTRQRRCVLVDGLHII